MKDEDGVLWMGSLVEGRRTVCVHTLTFGRARVSFVPAPEHPTLLVLAIHDPIGAAIRRGYDDGW